MRVRRVTAAAVLITGSVALSATSATAVPPVTTLVSVGQGRSADGYSELVSPSGDGRYVAFTSTATNLVPGGTNGILDLFVRDLTTRQTELVSVSTSGAKANDYSDIAQRAMTSNGRYVAFSSDASNLVRGDTNRTSDCFVRDLLKHTTVRVSLGRGGVQGNDASYGCHVTNDGKTVAFSSFASNLVKGDTNAMPDVFVRTLATGAIRRLTLTPSGAQSVSGGVIDDMTPDGRLVVIESISDDLGPGDTNGALDLYVANTRTGRMTRVSVGTGGTLADQGGERGSISADGSRVAFQTFSSLDPADTNRFQDVYVYDLASARTYLASLGRNGVVGDEDSIVPSLSGDGTVVAFESYADNLFPGDTNQSTDVFRRTVGDPGLRLISQAPDGTLANGGSVVPVITRDAGAIAYSSDASNLVGRDDNGLQDVFLAR